MRKWREFKGSYFLVMTQCPEIEKTQKFSTSLEGLRGYCILFVMLEHWEFIDFGWVGVQVFFVLSGYLITDSLMQIRNNFSGWSRYAIFYYRRTLRIFPIYFALLFVFGLLFVLFKKPKGFDEIAPYAFTYTINLRRIFPGFPESYHFSHLWSLSVEEQFYLVWPFIIFNLNTIWLRITVIACVVLAPILRLLTVACLGHSASHALIGRVVYNLTTSHIDAFACGAAIAIGIAFFTQKTARNLAIATLVTSAFGYSFGHFTEMAEPVQYIAGYSVLNITAALLISFLLTKSKITVLFSNTPIRSIGRISYGMYILHFPLRALLPQFDKTNLYQTRSLTCFFIWLLATYFLALLSFNFYEMKFLKLKERPPRWIRQPGAQSLDK